MDEAEDEPFQLLIVDDDEVDRAVVCELLKGDCACHAVESAELAFEWVERGAPDCILLDYVLPDADALALLSAWVEKRLPVVLMTGRGDERIAVEAMKRGASDYLVKDNFDRDNLLRIVRNAIERNGLARQLAERQRDLESFASVASHDLQAPLRHIDGIVRRIQERPGAGADRDLVNDLGDIRASIGMMTRLLDALHDYAWIDRGGAVRAVDLNDALGKARTNIEESVRQTGADIGSERLPQVRGDEVALVQLFQNLLLNALKYREGDPPTVRVAAEARDQGWCISVTDRGIGIAPEHHGQIFEPFKRLHPHGRFEGSGIGLATCKKIVERHGGKIWVESERGKGATFLFTLPQ